MRTLPAIAVACAALACEAPAAIPDPPVPSLTRVSVRLDQDADHLVESARFADVWYATNSNDGLTAVRVLADGGLEPLFPRLDMGIRCATVDVHPSSATLLCSNEYAGRLYVLSLADPSAPVLVGELELYYEFEGYLPQRVPVSDVHVWGDEVWLAGYTTGIWRASLDASGQPSGLERVAEPGNVRKLGHHGDELIALVAERGLVVLGPERDGAWVERGSVSLDGPLIDLHVDAGRAVVALGSAGAATVDLATRTTLAWATVAPPTVVAAVALRGDRLAVGGLTGLFVYELALGSEPALIGYSRAGSHGGPQPGSLLDLHFEGEDDLFATDWYLLHRHTIDEAGAILEVELPTGLYRRPGDPIEIPIRSHGAVEQDVAATLFEVELGQVRVGPGDQAVLRVELDEAREAELFPPDSTRRVTLHRTTLDGARLEEAATLVATTAADHDPAVDGRPAPGMPFPSVQLGKWEAAPLTLPPSDQAMWLVFYSEDCQAMWPQLLDLAWLWRRGDLGGMSPVLASNGPIDAGLDADRFDGRMGLADLAHGYFENVDPEVEAFNEPLNPLYERGFALERLESAAAHPTDYLVDADGTVVAVEREYRGAHPLRERP